MIKEEINMEMAYLFQKVLRNNVHTWSVLEQRDTCLKIFYEKGFTQGW